MTSGNYKPLAEAEFIFFDNLSTPVNYTDFTYQGETDFGTITTTTGEALVTPLQASSYQMRL